jgi:hypothetical protein
MSIASKAAVAAAAGITAGAASAGTLYTDVAAFTAASNIVELNDFSGVADGFYSSLTFEPPAYQTFQYEIVATNGLQVGPSLNPFVPLLPSGAISTQAADDALVVNFTSNNVYAVGGEFWGTGLLGQPVWANITINLSDGTSVTFETFGPEFYGFTSDVVITSMTIEAERVVLPGHLEAWATMDNLYVGTLTVIPLPPAAWAGLGMLGLLGGARAFRRRG